MEKKKAQIQSLKIKIFQPNIKGQEIIKFIAKTLTSHQPGVYQMEDDEWKYSIYWKS